MLLNFILVPNVVKIPRNNGRLGLNCVFRRKFTKEIWLQKTNEIIKRKAKIFQVDQNNWESVSSIIHRDVEVISAVGFDCEWNYESNCRKPVSLLQLATYSGNCFLFRFNSQKSNIPSSLRELLENKKILKVGVGCDLDAFNFNGDYKANVSGWLDLRHLAIEDDLKNCRVGLKSLAKHYLQKNLSKDWKLKVSDWGSTDLTQQQIEYAAEDAVVGIQILLAQLKNLWTPNLEEDWETSVGKAIKEICEPFVEVEFDQEKMKFCYVCGNNKVSRKSIVPQEYKRYIPKILNLNDIYFSVLLCKECSEKNSIKMNDLKQILAEECDAPIREDIEKKVQAACAAVSLKKNLNLNVSLRRNIPLTTILREYYETDELTMDLINQAADMHQEFVSEMYNFHSYKVFRYFQKIGLVHLLFRYQQWFLESMKPKYLSEHFFTTHEDHFSYLKMKMSKYPLDSNIRYLYKVILVGTDGEIDVPYQPDIKVGDTIRNSLHSEDYNKENKLYLSSTEQSVDQTSEKT